MDGLLLSQYAESTKLREYFMAFIGELDLLFQNVEEVYYGRFIETAIGAQLDIIGIILQQSRNVDLGSKYFGFDGAPLVDSFGTEANPSTGGTFKSSSQGTQTVTPLDDGTYRRVLLTKAFLLNSDNASINTVYHAVAILLDKVPRLFSITEPANKQLDITMAALDVPLDKELLINLTSKYFLPAGITLTITLL